MTTREQIGWLADAARERESDGLRRELRAREADESVIDLCSNDYLGLARDPRVIEGASRALHTWGAGSTGSRLVTGTTAVHIALEESLAEFAGAPAALVFATGYAANAGAITALSGPGALVVSDAANHASIVDGCRLSRARVVVTPHGAVDAISQALAVRDEERAVVVTESVFSVEGELAPLRALQQVCREHAALLIVDEAHAIGVYGPGGAGAVVAHGLQHEPDVVRTLTLSKSLGSQGGVAIGSPEVVDHLINTARSFIFDSALAPAAAGGALAALDVLRTEPERAIRARQRASQLAALVRQPEPSAAIVPVPIGSAERAAGIAAACLREGVRVGCFRPPSVPYGRSTLRLTGRATMTDDEMARAADVLTAALRK